MLKVQHGDTGVQFIVTITNQETGQIINVANATNIKFIFRRPDGTVYSVAGSLYSTGSDGKFVYVSSNTDFTTTGIWKFQVSYSLNTSSFTSIWQTFQVIPNLVDGV